MSTTGKKKSCYYFQDIWYKLYMEKFTYYLKKATRKHTVAKHYPSQVLQTNIEQSFHWIGKIRH